MGRYKARGELGPYLPEIPCGGPESRSYSHALGVPVPNVSVLLLCVRHILFSTGYFSKSSQHLKIVFSNASQVLSETRGGVEVGGRSAGAREGPLV